MVNIGNDWDALLEGEFEKPYYKQLRAFLTDEYRTRRIYPDMYSIFNALRFTPYHAVRVVILGQDPYPGPNQAHGLAFSVQQGVATPRSLQNIYQELHTDCGCYIPNNGYLKKWADQGVLLLNTSLTVRAGAPNSHKDKGWELFTDRIIELLNEREEGIVFLLWGANAKAKAARITAPQHPDIDGGAPEPHVGGARVLRLPALFAGKPYLRAKRDGADRLAD